MTDMINEINAGLDIIRQYPNAFPGDIRKVVFLARNGIKKNDQIILAAMAAAYIAGFKRGGESQMVRGEYQGVCVKAFRRIREAIARHVGR
jgi:hypothetical protein